jgi:hypothetical protein
LLRQSVGSATADVQSLVEFFVQLLLLGIEFRHLLLFILVRRRLRSKLLGAGLQMADRRATRQVVAEPGSGSALTAASPETRTLPTAAAMKGIERMDCSIEIERKADADNELIRVAILVHDLQAQYKRADIGFH